MATVEKEKYGCSPSSSDQAGASGAYSNSAIAMMPPGQALPASEQERVLGIKIARAMLSGPREITKDARVAEMHMAKHFPPRHQRLGLFSRR